MLKIKVSKRRFKMADDLLSTAVVRLDLREDHHPRSRLSEDGTDFPDVLRRSNEGSEDEIDLERSGLI